MVKRSLPLKKTSIFRRIYVMQPQKKSQRDPNAKPSKDVSELLAQVAKLTNIAARAQADLQNAKMRMGKDAEELRAFAAESVIRKLLPTIDNFQRAFQHLPDLKKHEGVYPELVEWIRGITSIEQELMKRLAEMGLKKFESIGKPIDAARHEVLMTGPGKEGMVVEVFEDGYELHGRVLRPAKVKAGDGTAIV